jgi:hypothetical protein
MTASTEPHDAQIVSLDAVTREATLRRLAQLTRRADGPPSGALRLAEAAYRWRSIDDELAALVYDSATDPHRLVSIRATEASSRHLTFEAPELVLEVEVTLSRRRDLLCQIVPPQRATLEVRSSAGTVTADTDLFGTVQVTSLAPGPVSLRCVPQHDDSTAVATSWISI